MPDYPERSFRRLVERYQIQTYLGTSKVPEGIRGKQLYSSSMADPGDVEGTKILRREFNKRAIDITQADLRVMHGVAYVRGLVRAMKGAEQPVSEMLDQVSKAVRSRPEIREVVIDCQIRGE